MELTAPAEEWTGYPNRLKRVQVRIQKIIFVCHQIEQQLLRKGTTSKWQKVRRG
ncbi:hypothetical protein SCA6_014331, partial [Theobroma cacao]